jgi:hypothetical protein
VYLPSSLVAVPAAELLKNTLARAKGFLLSALVTTPETIPPCASTTNGKNKQIKMSQGNRIV